MVDLFLKLVDMSVAAGWVALAVMEVRLAIRKAPRWITVMLWALVAVRLICPVSFESSVSLMHLEGSREAVDDILGSYSGPSASYWDIHEEYQMAVDAGIAPIHGGDGNFYVITGETPTTPVGTVADHAAKWWIWGMAAMLAYTAYSYLRLKRKVAPSMHLSENIYLCDYIDTPFILGIVRPKIYLPSSMDPDAASHVLAHERAHLKRKDHWWKPFGFALLTIHWFNPLLWLAYILLCRDIEMACDEKVVKDMEALDKKAYSEALLRCSVSRRMIAACPLAFGEVGVKERVKTVLNYKKPAFWVVLLAVIALLVAAVCLLTDPVKDIDGQRKFDIPGPNVGDMDVQEVMDNIRRYERLEDNENPYTNDYVGSIILHGNFDYEVVGIPYFYYRDGKIGLSQAIFSDLAESCTLLGQFEWEEQESIYLLEHYLNALKYMPQEEIKEMLPDAEHYEVRFVEKGTPGSYDRVIRYSNRGVGATDGWLIHLEVIPCYHGEDGGFHETGEPSVHVFYGDTPADVNGVIMDAKILEISNKAYLVEPMPGSQERNSADKIWVPMQINVEPVPRAGEIVRITYDGQLMESYPAQIGQVFRIQVVTDEYTILLDPDPMVDYLYKVDDNGLLSNLSYPDDYVIFNKNYVNISVPKLEGWEYEIQEWYSDDEGSMLSCGIRFRPKGEEGWVALRYHEFLEVALKHVQVPVQNILKESWPYHEVNVSRAESEELWRYIRYVLFRENGTFIPGTYIAWNEGADAWMAKDYNYRQLMAILKAVRLAEGLLREDEAVAIARTVSTETQNLDYSIHFNRFTDPGSYDVSFLNEEGVVVWDVRVDNEGNILKVNGQDFSRTYQYEKEGFGGDFIIKLSGDGVAMYYEGGLSSYIGLGTWVQEENIVTVTVEQKLYRFRLEENALVFIEEGSTNFTYIQVAGGERFYLQEG